MIALILKEESSLSPCTTAQQGSPTCYLHDARVITAARAFIGNKLGDAYLKSADKAVHANIELIDGCQSIASSLQRLDGHFMFTAPRYDGPTLSALTLTTATEVRKVLTSSRLEPLPLDILPVAAVTVHRCLYTCAGAYGKSVVHSVPLPAGFKTAQVTPLLKKPGLDISSMSNFRPISNLSAVSKVIERLVRARWKPQLHFCRLQSAYRTSHST